MLVPSITFIIKVKPMEHFKTNFNEQKLKKLLRTFTAKGSRKLPKKPKNDVNILNAPKKYSSNFVIKKILSHYVRKKFCLKKSLVC